MWISFCLSGFFLCIHYFSLAYTGITTLHLKKLLAHYVRGSFHVYSNSQPMNRLVSSMLYFFSLAPSFRSFAVSGLLYLCLTLQSYFLYSVSAFFCRDYSMQPRLALTTLDYKYAPKCPKFVFEMGCCFIFLTSSELVYSSFPPQKY